MLDETDPPRTASTRSGSGPAKIASRPTTILPPRSVALLVTASLLAGCAVGPDYRTPLIPTPASWSKAASTTSPKPPRLSQWWTRLRDPLLNELIEDAVVGNLDVATAMAKIRQARATYRQAVGALFPTLTNSESVQRTNETSSSSSSSTTSSGGAMAPYTLYQAGFDASWELDLFGANKRAVEAAGYGVEASEDSLRSTLLTLVGDIASNYVQARGYQARIALARRTAASQAETAEITRRKFAAGSTSAVDVANAAGQAASTRATIPTLETSYAQTVHQLSVLTGRAPADLNSKLAKATPIPTPRLPIPVGIPAEVLLSRPDVRLAERQYAQYTAKIGQAEAALYPSVSLTGSIATAGTKLGDLGKSSSISWAFGPTLTVPIFNGGQLRAAVDIAEAERDQYFIAYRSSVLTALKDVEDAIVALAKERSRVRELAASATSYRQAATLSRALYQAGTASFLDVLTAERSLYTAEDSRLESQVLITTDYIALNKALGGGWNGMIDASKPEVVDTNTGPHLLPVRDRQPPP